MDIHSSAAAPAHSVRHRYGHFYSGQWQDPCAGAYIPIEDPSTGEVFSECARGNAEDVARAVDDARKGFERWRALEPMQRGRIMLEVAHRLQQQLERFAYIESRDTGKPISVARGDVLTCARYFEYFGGAADKMFGEVIPASNDHLVYSVREPFGVTGHILPWNAPLSQAGRGAAPALCAGNSVVLKPAELAPLSTLELAELCVEAGVPEGVLNVVSGYGDEVGSPLADHPAVRRISFTGSVATGRKVLHQAAERIVPATVELGGKSPFILFRDADLERAASLAKKAFVFNTGQICSAGTRLLVERAAIGPFIECLKAELGRVTVGPGLEDPSIGPVISNQQLKRIRAFLQIGESEGARIAVGGQRPSHLPAANGGYFIEPTLFVDATNNMRIAREEIFGPVGVIIPFDDETEAVAIANDSDYGLAAAIWSTDVGRTHRLATRIEAGQVYINDYQPIGVEAPFGGYKNSGYGREKGLACLHDYSQLKTVIAYRGE